MTLAEAMQAVAPARGTRRKLDGYLATMGEDDRALVQEWLADEVGYSAAAIAKALTLAGYPIGATAIKDYRRSV